MSLNKDALSHLWNKISSFFVAKKEGYYLISDDEKASINNAIALNESSLGLQKKNLLPFPKSIHKEGITFTCDTDGYMTASDTTSDIRQWTVANSQYSVYLDAGTYILSFVSDVVCSNAYGNIMIKDSAGNSLGSIGQANYYNKESGNTTFTLSSAQTVYVMLKCFDGSTAIMIRDSAIRDDTYEPFVDDVQTQIDTVSNDVDIAKVSLGLQKKNLLKITATNGTVNGITRTVNSDGSINVKGTNSLTDPIFIDLGTVDMSSNKYYIVSGCPSGGSKSTYFLAINGMNTNQYDIGNGSNKYKPTTSKYISIVIGILPGTTIDNIFYPMVRYAHINDSTYEPYIDDIQTQINNLLARIEALESGS